MKIVNGPVPPGGGTLIVWPQQPPAKDTKVELVGTVPLIERVLAGSSPWFWMKIVALNGVPGSTMVGIMFTVVTTLAPGAEEATPRPEERKYKRRRVAQWPGYGGALVGPSRVANRRTRACLLSRDPAMRLGSGKRLLLMRPPGDEKG